MCGLPLKMVESLQTIVVRDPRNLGTGRVYPKCRTVHATQSLFRHTASVKLLGAIKGDENRCGIALVLLPSAGDNDTKVC